VACHAYQKHGCTSGDSQPCRHSGLASLFHGDFDVLAKQDQESHQALERETGQVSLLEGGDLRLVDSENRGRLALREAAP